MTTKTRIAAVLLTTGTLAALTGGSAQAMTLPESGPPHLVPSGSTTTYDSRAFEEAIAACMEARGFDYEPYLYTVESTPMKFEDGTTGIGIDMQSFQGGEDPNEAIVAQLTPARRAAYFRALHGPVNPLDAQGYPTGRSLGSSDDSCNGRAG